MSNPDFYMHAGDTPTISLTLVDYVGAAININGASVALVLWQPGLTPDTQTTHVMTNLDDGTLPNRGKVSYTFAAADTNVYGADGQTIYLRAMARVTWSGPVVLTMPSPGFLEIQVDPA